MPHFVDPSVACEECSATTYLHKQAAYIMGRELTKRLTIFYIFWGLKKKKKTFSISRRKIDSKPKFRTKCIFFTLKKEKPYWPPINQESI